MKLNGDVSKEDKELSLDLERMEAQVEANPKISKELLAKCYTCLAHDWLQMDMEEEAFRLIEKAEKASPGYFQETIKIHIDQNPDFKKVAQNISLLLLDIAINRLKEKQK